MYNKSDQYELFSKSSETIWYHRVANKLKFLKSLLQHSNFIQIDVQYFQTWHIMPLLAVMPNVIVFSLQKLWYIYIFNTFYCAWQCSTEMHGLAQMQSPSMVQSFTRLQACGPAWALGLQIPRAWVPTSLALCCSFIYHSDVIMSTEEWLIPLI